MLKYYDRPALTSSRLDRADIGALEVCFWCRSRPPTRRSTSSPRLRRRTNALRPRISVGNDDRLQADRVIGPYDVARRIAAGRTKRDIIRCLKRFLAREIYQRVMTDFRARQEIIQAA